MLIRLVHFFLFNSSTSSPPEDLEPGRSGRILLGTAGSSGKLSSYPPPPSVT
ncbi:hypothetical protein DPMN_045616 [Dreissena polymorpha]|uniref:Uncharacterized protein n=1 Tax=Dreissena polymorpha TaxID=45954 RepID=A0A9D4D6D1_DREPO|nr:hypothetical protein DPMN_045616 [Dreissena polymorpha]